MMDRLQHVFDMIAHEGFADITIQEINNYVNDIQNGTEIFFRFNLSEHAGLCTAGAPLIGASIGACYATASITASSNAEGGQGQCKSRAEISTLDFCRDAAISRSLEQGSPANWEIDELQEQLIEQ
ncbi:MAG: hypothetical protein IJ637_00050 [Prevotella sp.]|nr:hypothetical protein [Prevotella sp.]